MRILQCIPSLDAAYGGPARSVPQLATALAGLGNEVGLWSAQPSLATLPDYGGDTGVRLLSGAFDRAVAEFGRPDLIHDNGIWVPCHHRIAREAARRGIPRVVSSRGMLQPWALKYKYWKKRMALWLYQRRDLSSASCLHATSNVELSQFRHLGLKQPAIVLPNGVTFPAEVRKETSHERRAGVREALFLSRIHPSKGLPILVEAWARIRPKGWVMNVVGPDETNHLRKIADAVNRSGLNDCWTFHGIAEGAEKWRHYSKADLFILPSYSENFGIVVAEALASGTPVITTTSTPWQGLHEHRCGWWVEPTVTGIADALKTATALPAAGLSEMGQRGMTWIHDEFAWPSLAQKMAAMYHWICSGGERPEFIDFAAE